MLFILSNWQDFDTFLMPVKQSFDLCIAYKYSMITFVLLMERMIDKFFILKKAVAFYRGLNCRVE